MEISRDLTLRVLRRITAAKAEVELPPEQKGKEDKPGTVEDPLQGGPGQPVDLQVINRLYFFSAPAGKDIPFYQMYSILSGNAEGVNGEDKRELVENLKGGSAPYAGDWFKWIGLAILCEDPADSQRKASYMYLLSPWGTFDSARTRMAKTGQADFEVPSADEAAKRFSLFKTVQDTAGAINNMVDIATGPGTFFSTTTPSEDLVDKMLVAKPESLVQGARSDFDVETFNAQYRIRVVGVGRGGTELRNIDGTSSNKDELGPNKRGHYVGGEQAFQQLIEASGYKPEKPEAVEQPEEKGAPEESLGEKVEKQEENQKDAPQYRPVDEVEPTNKKIEKERTINASKEAYIREVNKDEPGVNQYEGDWSIMQDLVRRQHKKMKIRKEAAGTIDLEIPAQPEPTEEAGKALQELSKSLRTFQDTAKDLQRSTGMKITQTPGMGPKMANMVDKVVGLYLGI